MTTHRARSGSKEPLIRERWESEMGLVPYEMKSQSPE